MARYEHTGGAVPTTLSGAVDAAATTLSVAALTGWPTGGVGDFFITVDRGTASEEKMRCSAASSGTITVAARGVDNTTAHSHEAGAIVEHTFTAAEADAANAHIEASSGVHGVTGEVVGTTKSQTLTNKLLSGLVNTFSNIPQSAITGLEVALGELGGYLATHLADLAAHGASGAVVGTTNTQTLTNKTLTTPTIGSFVNANHDHEDAAGGGTLGESGELDLGLTGGATLTLQYGNYFKQGQLVQVNGLMSINNPGSGTLTLTGLPFASSDDTSYAGATMFAMLGDDSTGKTYFGIVQVTAGTTTAYVQFLDTNGELNTFSATSPITLAAGDTLRVFGTYPVDA